jgi:hypothetical protein
VIRSSGADPKLAAELIALKVEVMLAAGLVGGVLLEKLGAMIGLLLAVVLDIGCELPVASDLTLSAVRPSRGRSRRGHSRASGYEESA